jgi:hypothetical protein
MRAAEALSYITEANTNDTHPRKVGEFGADQRAGLTMWVHGPAPI